MTRLQRQWEALQGGELPEPEEMDGTVVSLPLLVGADGVMVPFRPNGGQPNGARSGARSKWASWRT